MLLRVTHRNVGGTHETVGVIHRNVVRTHWMVGGKYRTVGETLITARRTHRTVGGTPEETNRSALRTYNPGWKLIGLKRELIEFEENQRKIGQKFIKFDLNSTGTLLWHVEWKDDGS